MMELTQLYYFSVVARLEHFHKAAQELHITQPTLSQSIARLEDELGCPLFERSGRNVYLNEYGKEFYHFVSKSLVLLEDGKHRIFELLQGKAGDVKIGVTVPETISFFLRTYITENPFVHVHQSYGTALQFQDMLNAREIDFAITVLPIEAEEILWEPVFTESLGILVSTKHPLAKQTSVTIDQLRNERFIVNNSNRDLCEIFQHYFIQAGYQPNIVFEGEQADLIGELISLNCGISFTSNQRHKYHKERNKTHNLHYLDISDPVCIRTTGFAKLRGRPLSPVAENFYCALKQALQEKIDPNIILSH